MRWKITESLALNLAQNKTSLSSTRVLIATSVPGPPELGARDTGDQGDKTDKPASVDWPADTVAGCFRGTASTVRNKGQ